MSLMCFVGVHSGDWVWVGNYACNQSRTCVVCGQTSLRTKHMWDGGLSDNGESRECIVCGKIEYHRYTREELCAGLRYLGVSAAVADRRGRTEERSGADSIGLVDIDHSPIRWVNVRKWVDEGLVYATDYGVPDSRTLPKLSLKSVRVRSFPVLGSVIDVRWEGGDTDTGVIGRLSSDMELKTKIIACNAEITVRTSPEYKCWLITHNSKDAPSAELWACYERVALNLPVTGYKVK